MIWNRKDLLDLVGICELEDYRGFSIIYTQTSALAKGEMTYQIHNRPSVYLCKQLLGKPYISRLKVKGRGSQWYAFDSPLTLMALGIDERTPLYLQLAFPVPGELPIASLHELIDVINNYTETEEYRNIRREKAQSLQRKEHALEAYYMDSIGDLEKKYGFLKDNYESVNQEYMLIKLMLENFILNNVLRIEELIRSNTSIPEIDWDEIDIVFRMTLFNKDLGIFSLENAFDNLLQMREICAEYHRQRQAGKETGPYQAFCLEWGRRYMEAWRSAQDVRILYFYDRESVYYRDLFLTVLIREPDRLMRFLTQWGSRLEYSLFMRQHLDEVLSTWKRDILPFADYVQDKGDFLEMIDSNLKTVRSHISMHNDFLQLIKEKRIYLAEL